MHPASNPHRHEAQALAQLLAQDLEPLGQITLAAHRYGVALYEEDVMFGFVDFRGTAFLRVGTQSIGRLLELGGGEHPEVPYWSLPPAATSDLALLREIAHDAVDVAHFAAALGLDDYAIVDARSSFQRLSLTRALTAHLLVGSLTAA